jgi:2-keto-4-pentenoate hydratase
MNAGSGAMSAMEQAATRLRQAELANAPCAPVRDLIDAADIATAYAVQQCNIDHGLAAGRRPLGRNVGEGDPAPVCPWLSVF